MSAAQTLAPGLPSSASSARSASSPGRGSAAESGDATFNDTLETASRSGEEGSNEDGRVTPKRARGREDGNGNGDASAGRGESSRGENASFSASDLSAILSALGATAEAVDGDAGSDALARAAFSSPAAAGEPLEDGPFLPGQVGEDGEALDADKLLLLLRSGAAKAPAEARPDIVAIKVSVVGQETHLALDKAPSEALAALAAREGAEPTAQQVNGAGKAAGLGAVLSQAADEAAKSVRVPGAPAAGDPASKADAGAVSRVGSIAENWGGRGGSMTFADQGISGRDGGRQSDGRGSSGSGSQQQQGTGQFMQAIAGANPQAAGAVRDAVGANAGYETVSDQIAAEVRAELRADGMADASSKGVSKVLHLELAPANLGSVTIRLALKDNVITMQIATQRPETLAAIERDRQALTEAMTKAGYSVDAITVVQQSDLGRAGSSPAGLGDSASSASQGGASGQAGQDQGHTDSSGGQGDSSQAGSGHSPHRHPSDDKDANASGVRRDANGLYV